MWRAGGTYIIKEKQLLDRRTKKKKDPHRLMTTVKIVTLFKNF